MTSLHTSDRAITQRQPATANLLISSLDRSDGTTAGAFSISRANSMLNGFFTRIAVPEVVLDWNIPNVYDISGDYVNIGSGLVYNCILSIDISGGSSKNIVKIPIGTYTVASVLDTIVARVNAAAIGTTLSVTQAGAAVTLTGTTAYRFSPTSVYNTLVWLKLGFAISTTYSTAGVTKTIYTSAAVTTSAQEATPNLFRILGSFGPPNLERIQYLDFVSYKLTNNQRLKDASTATSTRDILCRWYLTAGTQNPLPVDKYGFVIYPQYQQFSERRTFSPPKQINWETNIPIGQLSFEVWATDLEGSTFQLNSQGYEWLMTLHVSEN